MDLSFVFLIKELLPPFEMALTIGIPLLALSFIRPRRIISLPATGSRTATLAWLGIGGSLLVVLVAAVVSDIAASTYDTTGFGGWWRRPAPLFIATFIVAVAALRLRAIPLSARGERGISPRRSWHAFSSRALLWVSGIAAAFLAVTTIWHTSIGTSAPASGQFFGRTPEHTDLPIYMPFNEFGYLTGAGWPNHLATLAALSLACVILVVALRVDANRPTFARTSAASVRAEREITARLFTLVILGGLITTLGAVWMHTGFSGQGLVALDEEWGSPDTSDPQIFVSGTYDAIAQPMNLLGHVVQASGVAFLLRLAVDTTRALLATRKRQLSPTNAPANAEIRP